MNIKNSICCLLLSVALLCSCNRGETVKSEPSIGEKTSKIVHVYYFKGFDERLGRKTIERLHATFDSVVYEGTLPYPDSAYYVPRHRYKADKLAKHLRAVHGPSSELVIAFSPKDISAQVHGYDDFGVLGWTRCHQHSSIVSTYRIKDKSRLDKDFIKLVLHEMGHADGLPHCQHSATCYLRDAKGKYHLPELDGFCPDCKTYLERKGWHL